MHDAISNHLQLLFNKTWGGPHQALATTDFLDLQGLPMDRKDVTIILKIDH
jgi:hypothetical protein